MDAASRHYFVAAGVGRGPTWSCCDRHHRHAARRRLGAVPASGDLRRRDRRRDVDRRMARQELRDAARHPPRRGRAGGGRRRYACSRGGIRTIRRGSRRSPRRRRFASGSTDGRGKDAAASGRWKMTLAGFAPKPREPAGGYECSRSRERRRSCRRRPSVPAAACCSRLQSSSRSPADWCSSRWSRCRSSRSSAASSSRGRCPATSRCCRCARHSRRRRFSRSATSSTATSRSTSSPTTAAPRRSWRGSTPSGRCWSACSAP